MMEKVKEQKQEIQKTNEPVAKSKTTIVVLTLGCFVLAGLFYWLIFLRPFISTDDARVDTNVVKVVNLGISGQIISIAVKEGNAVSIGQVLAELDHRNAQLSYNIAKSKADLTAVKLSRDEAIMSSQGISKQQLDITKSEYIVSQSNLKMAELALERTYIKSPCNGVIIQKTATAGNVLEGSQVAFTIVDIDNAWISANINEKQVSKISIGQSVKVNIDSGGTLEGRVADIRDAANSVFALIPSDNAVGNFIKLEQRIPIKVELKPHPQLKLKIGQSVEIKIKVI